jgi:hypothetical protein
MYPQTSQPGKPWMLLESQYCCTLESQFKFEILHNFMKQGLERGIANEKINNF